ncbi:Maestro heat-like repeat-containing protein family member 7, partial [Varanus komodoensis]
ALYGQTVEAMEAMLQGLLSEKPNTAELFVLLEHLDPWRTSGQEHERARAVKTFVFLLKAAATDPKFQVSHDSPKLGVLIGQLCLHLNDPKKKIGQHAMEGIYYLYTLIQCQNDNGMKTKGLIAEQHKMFKEILGSYDSARPHQNIAQIIKVPEIVEKIYQQLGSIYQFQERQLVMGIMSHLAHPYMAEVCEALLQLPFPIDRFAAEMWYVLTKMCSDDELTVLVNILLKKLQLSPKSTGNYIVPLAAASAFSKLLSMPKCTDVALDIYPRLLMSLLVQVHYSIRHNIIRNADSQEEFEPVRHIVTALKTLLLAVKCCYEFASFEREQGWKYLTSCKDHHRGVGLLARIMLQGCYYVDLLRILYLLVPFLERGDEEHQITAMAFFIELLCMSEARRLPGQYSLHRLKRGLDNENPVIRALCIKGLVNMADWPGKEVKLLLPAMTKGLSGMDGRLFVESVTEIEKILAGPEGADCVCNITLSLQELFNDENESVRASAIYLFGRMVKLARKSNKRMIRPQVLENMVPLLLHLQEENPVVSKKCKNALEESFHFLGWKPPKQLICGKAWYKHEEVLDETCQYLVQKQEGNLKRFLYQGLFYTENELLSIKRASIMFLGFLILHMDSSAGMVDLDMIYHTLECLMHDPDASVSIAAAHAHDRVSAVLSKQQTRQKDNINTGASNSASDKPTRNSRSHNSVRITSSSLFDRKTCTMSPPAVSWLQDRVTTAAKQAAPASRASMP